MDAKMMEAIAAHRAAQKQKEAEAQKRKRKRGSAADGFHAFHSFDAKTSQAVAHGKKPRQEAVSDDSDSQPEEENEEGKKQLPPVDWSEEPAELLPRAEVGGGSSAALFVSHFVRFVMGRWRKALADGTLQAECMAGLSDTMRAIYESDASVRETQDWLAPLIQQLENGKVDEEIMKHLDKMIGLAADREYKEAMVSYVEITIGKKKWNNAVMFGEAKHNKGFNSRRVKRDEDNKFDSDETVKKYIQAIRRIFNFAQVIRPNDDVSKHM